ncbi:hypothetical protein S83_031735, partial [Arachis hypogaea]
GTITNAKTWKEVCFACVDAEEFRLAQICGLNIIVQVDDLEEVSEYYQNRGCFNNENWKELTYLYIQYDEFDNAATTIMNHSPEAWDHLQFKDVIVKVANVELYYKAVHFYFQEHPDLINDVLNVLALPVDDIMRK